MKSYFVTGEAKSILFRNENPSQLFKDISEWFSQIDEEDLNLWDIIVDDDSINEENDYGVRIYYDGHWK